MKDHWPMIMLACICMVITALTTAVLATYLKPIFDDIFIGHRSDLLLYIALGVLGVFVTKGVSEYGGLFCMEYVGQKMMLEIQSRLFAHIIFLDLDFFHQKHGAELMSILTNDVRIIRNSILQSLTGIVKESVTILGLLFVMLRENIVLSGISLLGFPLALWPLIYCGKRVRRLTHHLQTDVAALQIFFHQVFQGIALVKTTHSEKMEIDILNSRLSLFFHKSMKTFGTKAVVHPIMEILGGCAIVFVILNGGQQVIAGTQTTGSFLTFITALLFIYRPVKNIIHMNAALQEGLAASTRVLQIYQTQPRNPRILIQESLTNKEIKAGLFNDDLVLDNLSFRYPGANEYVLEKINLRFSYGKRLALVGPSGSGKTTLLYLLLRLYHPDSGSILWGSKDIQNIDLECFRNQISFVSQDITLFDDTVLNNVRYGRPDATREEVYQACALAYADEFIDQLPHRFESRIGENGVRLSGGQRQRLALARAFLRNSPLLLLDEATSCLDTLSEQKIQNALFDIGKNRTTLVIAHRLSTVESADQIFVLNKGHLVESGTHDQLMKEHGIYSSMVVLQKAYAA